MLSPDALAGAADALFWTGFALLFAHELDAVRAREWRLLLVLKHLPEPRGRDGFVLVHVPLLAVLLWLGSRSSPDVRFWFQVAFDLFSVVHVALHRWFRHHDDYDFHGGVSRLLILGAGAVGALHLMLLAVSPDGSA